MKRILIGGILGICLSCIALTANATVIFNLGGCDITNDGGGGSCGGSGADIPQDSLVLTFMDTAAPDTVRLTLDASEMPDGLGKIKSVWFNVAAPFDYSDLSFAHIDGVAASQAAGGNVGDLGIFDIQFQYGTSGPLGDFYYDLNSVYDITATGLVASDFNDLSTKGYPAVMHLCITGNGESGHYTVPEPASMLLFGTGLVGLFGYGRRRSKK